MEFTVRKNEMIAMRDSIRLATDVYSVASDEPRPTLLIRTPYDKDLAITGSDVGKYLEAGYAVVTQDVRGRFRSEGSFDPFHNEPVDGADTLEWLVAQEWCDGRVCMAGASYVGATQWTAASQGQSSLKAISPSITASSYFEGWTYQGGARQLGFTLSWTLNSLAFANVAREVAAGRLGPDALASIMESIDNIDALYRHAPLSDVPVLRDVAPYYSDWLAHNTDDEFWRSTAPRERYASVVVPSFNIGGWYDLFLGGTIANYKGMKEQGGSESARRPRLLIGPWSHGVMTGDFPWQNYGVASNSLVANVVAQQIRFFDRYVKNVDNGLDQEPPVRIFVMGTNVWRDEADWPLPDTVYVPYYLRSNGTANSARGDGALSIVPPSEEPPDSYLYNPHDPALTVGGQTFLPGLAVGKNAGPRDRREVEQRADVLCFTSETLTRDVEVTGEVSLILFAASSALDTDFTAALVDVDPDGHAIPLTEGILRARYRNSLDTAELLEPGAIYELTIDLWATANVFLAGHRIRLEVSSSNFPRFDRNSNTGGSIANEAESAFVSARNQIFHDGTHPSRLVLPIIDRTT